MTDLNTVTLIGRMTRDIELKYTNSGMAIGSGSLALNRTQKKGDEFVEQVSYIEFQMFGKFAESMAQYATKGKQVGITGSLRQDRWQAPDGSNRSKVFVNVDQMQLLGGRSESNGSDGQDYDEPQF